MTTPSAVPTVEQPIIEEKKPVDLGHDKLLSALFFFWDGFERATMNFFLVGATARQVKQGEDLSGDRLTLGIRKNEWVGGQQRIFRAFAEHNHLKPKGIESGLVFVYEGVPVYLAIYPDNPYITALDIAFYHNETFNLPNPLKDFEEKYGN